MALASTSSSLPDRMIRASRLDASLYREVDADETATQQAVIVVILESLANGIGAAIGAAVANRPSQLAGGLIGGIVTELIGWVVFTAVMWFVGTRIFHATATYNQVLRAVGFAYSPGVLLILRFIPVVGGLIALIVGIWRLITTFVGLREGLKLDNGQTIGTVIIGLIAWIIVVAVLAAIAVAIGLGAFAAVGGLNPS
jgi:Yip1 domain